LADLRKDPVTSRWVIVSADRQKRPSDFTIVTPTILGREHCPFCPGHESMTPPEIRGYRHGSAPNTPGWDLRVVPNRFPALRVEGTLDRQGEGMFDRMSGIGAHEVVIETTDHDKTFATMSVDEITRVLWAFRDRVHDLKNDFRFRYILLFKNHGAGAGATLEHGHSQLIALPIVPNFVREELDGARRHYQEKERCVFCDIIRQETTAGTRVIHENADMVALAPYASRVPFETWVLPRSHASRYEDAPRNILEGLAGMLKQLVARIDKALEKPPYNLIVHSAPLQEGNAADAYFHWHVELMPRISRIAGFEWGSGFYINPTSPEEATEVLRAVRL
jgi:UDPglucose--hexose-1-phosphate uridylyltransferase